MAAPYTLTVEDVAAMFNNPNLVNNTASGTAGIRAGNVLLVDDPFGSGRGTVLRMDLFKDEWGRGQSDIVQDPEPFGMQTEVHWAGTPNPTTGFDEIYYAFDIAVDIGFIWPKGIHMWNMMNDTDGLESDIPTRNTVGKFILFEGGLGQTNAILPAWVPPGGDHSLSTYYYNYDNAQRYKFWTDNPTLAPSDALATALYARHTPGSWSRMEAHYKLNTSDATPDGILECWINHVKVLEITDFKWRGTVPGGIDYMSKKFNKTLFALWLGGNDQSWASAQDQSIYFDNLIVSTSPITHSV